MMVRRLIVVAVCMAVALWMAGCNGPTCCEKKCPAGAETCKVAEPPKAPEAPAAAVAPHAPAAPAAAPAPHMKFGLRVNCGATEPYRDKAGVVWVADQEWSTDKAWGADGGMTIDRGDLGMTGTDSPRVYELERYSMNSYKFTVPNGTYTVRLHFAETYDGISGAEQRVFSVSLGGKEVLKDLDVFKESGGINKLLVKEFKGVSVSNGELAIGFTSNIQSPEINGIEVLAE